jgi:UrcA family protein
VSIVRNIPVDLKEMSAMRRYVNLKTVIPGLMLSTLLGSLGAAQVAAARPAPEFLTKRVKYVDLDLSRADGAAILYSRIRSAAHQVCDPPSSSVFTESFVAARACMRQAIAHAVVDVNAPALTNLHLAATGQSIRLTERQ